MAHPVVVREIAERHHAEWVRLVCGSPQGSVYSAPEYLDILCTATEGRSPLVGAWVGDDLVGGVALYEENQPFGIVSQNRLLLYYNGLVLREYQTLHLSERVGRAVGVLTALSEPLSGLPHARLVLHCRRRFDARACLERGWAVRPTYTYVVPLQDLETAWTRRVSLAEISR